MMNRSRWQSAGLVLSAGALALVLAAGCGDDGDDGSTTNSSTTSANANTTSINSSTTSTNSSTTSTNNDGGACAYQAYPGTCTGAADGTFTYTGTVAGSAVTFAGNTPDASVTLAEGETRDCTLEYITQGTCTPCLLDIGSCGREAFAGMP